MFLRDTTWLVKRDRVSILLSFNITVSSFLSIPIEQCQFYILNYLMKLHVKQCLVIRLKRMHLHRLAYMPRYKTVLSFTELNFSLQRIIKELLLKEDCNVMIVNWIGGAGPPYTQAVANTRLVGAMTARLLSQIINIGGIDPSKMHCIGHSLGAHTCGYIGYFLRGKYQHHLGRITGESVCPSLFSVSIYNIIFSFDDTKKCLRIIYIE